VDYVNTYKEEMELRVVATQILEKEIKDTKERNDFLIKRDDALMNEINHLKEKLKELNNQF
jgi:hypothetical protein